MWRSASLSITSVLCCAWACSDGTKPKPDAFCGAGSAGSSLDMVAGSATITYTDIRAGANNDCPDPMAPAGVVSMTIERLTPPLITICVPRPDKLNGGLALGTDVHLVDAGGSAGSCTYQLDHTMPITGTISSTGLCNNGGSAFALTIDAMFTELRTCGTQDTVSATISGTVMVTPQ